MGDETATGVLRRLKQTNEDLEKFAYGAAHDLKGPLRGINRLAGFVLEDVGDSLPDASRRHLEQIGELLCHERTALLVPPGDPDALRAGLQRLVDDEALRERLGRAARVEAEAKPTISPSTPPPRASTGVSRSTSSSRRPLTHRLQLSIFLFCSPLRKVMTSSAQPAPLISSSTREAHSGPTTSSVTRIALRLGNRSSSKGISAENPPLAI